MEILVKTSLSFKKLCVSIKIHCTSGDTRNTIYQFVKCVFILTQVFHLLR